MAMALTAGRVIEMVFTQPDQAQHVTVAVTGALQAYAGLQPMARRYVKNNGEEQLLVALGGTIPVEIRGGTYNIPVDLWLHGDFPSSSPMVYVVPTQTMMLKPSDLVDSNGRVALHPPHFYWNTYASSGPISLVRLIGDLSKAFGVNCPVIARPADGNHPISPPHQLAPPTQGLQMSPQRPAHAANAAHAEHATNQGHQEGHITRRGCGAAHAARAVAHVAVPSAHPPQQPQPQPRSAGDPGSRPGSRHAEEEREDVIRAVEAKIRSRMISIRNGGNGGSGAGGPNMPSMAEMTQQNAGLVKSAAMIAAFKETGERQLAIMQNELHELSVAHDGLDHKIRTLQVDAPVADDLVSAPTVVYEQMMQLIAEDRAIEDLLYGLFVSFRESRMDLASYMSKLRSLTREQFEIRTLLMRARDVAKSVYE